jgi:2-polyprenyl-6-methoxyphenol hydroxylase-like FAD-dependent oxidoreductase
MLAAVTTVAEDESMLEDNRHLPANHLLQGKKIAIIGGGPAGLTLARLLQMQNVSVRVFERDTWAHARVQGGSLDLHEKGGRLALERCGLIGHFNVVARPEGQSTTVIDKHGIRRASSTADDEGEFRPEIDRGALRELLLDSLSDTTVIWGRTLTGIHSEAERYRLVFAEGLVDRFDLVVGADGFRSKVRPHITSVEAFYTGVTFVETRLSDVDRRHPDVAHYVGPGSVLAVGDNKGLFAQRHGDGSIRVYVARRMPEHWLRDNTVKVENAARTREQLLAWFPDWASVLTDIVRRCDDHFLPWPLYAFPPDQHWKTVRGVTLIGDAAHVMPPFLGEGANMAMLDAVELSDHLLSDRFSGLTAAIAAFEEAMRGRVAPLIRGSLETQDILFAEDAPTALTACFAARR